MGCFDTIAMMHGDRIAVIASGNEIQASDSIIKGEDIVVDGEESSAEDVEISGTMEAATDSVIRGDESRLISIVDVDRNDDGSDDASNFSGNYNDDGEESKYEDGENSSESQSIMGLNGQSYIELQYNSKILACQLQLRFGVRLGDLVLVICGGHTAAEVVAMLACMRLGAAFVPVDDAWLHGGTDRLEAIVSLSVFLSVRLSVTVTVTLFTCIFMFVELYFRCLFPIENEYSSFMYAISVKIIVYSLFLA